MHLDNQVFTGVGIREARYAFAEIKVGQLLASSEERGELGL